MVRRLLLLGGGGHCRSVADSLLADGRYDEIGIVDYDPEVDVAGLPVVGNDEDLPALYADGWEEAFVAVGSVGNVSLRRKLFEKIKAVGFKIPRVADPTAVIARDALIAEGAYVGKNAVINAKAQVESFAIINSGAIVEHDVFIDAFTHVSPGATICGETKIGWNTHIGAGAVIKQGISIGSNVIIGAGSIVLKDIPDFVKAYGNPCKVVESCQ